MTAFTAVVTTGIYCRAGGNCSGRPLARNTRTYTTAAAAEAAGFRPCLVCRPDRAPASNWIDAPELVCRALRLISDGALDGGTEDELATRVGVSARHLRRLFVQHVGATPAVVARSQRAHFARRLLDDTDLTIAQVGAASGFQSVRQLNRVMKQVFHFTPQELRARRRDPNRLVTDGGLELQLPYRAPFAWDAMLGFLAPRAIPGVEAVDVEHGVYRRTIVADGEPAVIEVFDAPAKSHLVLRAHLSRFDGLVHLVARVQRLFDLHADPTVIDVHLARDRRLRPLVRAQPGLRVPGTVDPLELGVRAIVGQQVTVAHATRLAGRIVRRYGTPLPGVQALGLTHCFPDAAVLARARLDDIGLPATRAAAIRAYARAEIPTDGSLPLDELVGALRALPGVGEWTAHYIAMRAASEPDAFPASDAGLRHALGTADAAATRAAAEAWRPWRAYGAMHLWSSVTARG